jgi:hypothetical protein
MPATAPKPPIQCGSAGMGFRYAADLAPGSSLCATVAGHAPSRAGVSSWRPQPCDRRDDTATADDVMRWLDHPRLAGNNQRTASTGSRLEVILDGCRARCLIRVCGVRMSVSVYSYVGGRAGVVPVGCWAALRQHL